MNKHLLGVIIVAILVAFVVGAQAATNRPSEKKSTVTESSKGNSSENMSTSPGCVGESCQQTGSPPMSLPSQLVVYYFHGNARCMTCHKLEEYAKEAVEQNFGDEMKTGQIIFKAINTEQPGNDHFVYDYQLYTKSVVLSLTKDGKEIRYKNLDKIWEYVRDKARYENYIRDEAASFLKET